MKLKDMKFGIKVDNDWIECEIGNSIYYSNKLSIKFDIEEILDILNIISNYYKYTKISFHVDENCLGYKITHDTISLLAVEIKPDEEMISWIIKNKSNESYNIEILYREPTVMGFPNFIKEKKNTDKIKEETIKMKLKEIMFGIRFRSIKSECNWLKRFDKDEVLPLMFDIHMTLYSYNEIKVFLSLYNEDDIDICYDEDCVGYKMTHKDSNSITQLSTRELKDLFDLEYENNILEPIYNNEEMKSDNKMKLKDMKFCIKNIKIDKWVGKIKYHETIDHVIESITYVDDYEHEYNIDEIFEIFDTQSDISDFELYCGEKCIGYRITYDNSTHKFTPSNLVELVRISKEQILNSTYKVEIEVLYKCDIIYENKEIEGDNIIDEIKYIIMIKTCCDDWEFIGYEGQYSYYPRKKDIINARKFNKDDIDVHLGRILSYCMNLEPIEIKILKYENNGNLIAKQYKEFKIDEEEFVYKNDPIIKHIVDYYQIVHKIKDYSKIGMFLDSIYNIAIDDKNYFSTFIIALFEGFHPKITQYQTDKDCVYRKIKNMDFDIDDINKLFEQSPLELKLLTEMYNYQNQE